MKGSYIKVRLEVEIKGILRAADKGMTVTALWPASQLQDPDKEAPESFSEHTWNLDFSRANDLHESAKHLDGKVVIVNRAERDSADGGGNATERPDPG